MLLRDAVHTHFVTLIVQWTSEELIEHIKLKCRLGTFSSGRRLQTKPDQTKVRCFSGSDAQLLVYIYCAVHISKLNFESSQISEDDPLFEL